MIRLLGFRLPGLRSLEAFKPRVDRFLGGFPSVIFLIILAFVIGFNVGCWYTEASRRWTLTVGGSHFVSPFLTKPEVVRRGDDGPRKRIMCMILTSPATHRSRAVHVMATWGRHCDGLVFLTSGKDVLLPTLLVEDSVDRYAALWLKLREGLGHLYENYIRDYDFFLKVDDDSYVVVENLR
ncbi:unnamed protein product [Notodromas monacha]|nr:unnamed protein product [Notodromas monacha]CAG0914781.1 unnamed protein product [Notodromas monacha]